MRIRTYGPSLRIVAPVDEICSGELCSPCIGYSCRGFFPLPRGFYFPLPTWATARVASALAIARQKAGRSVGIRDVIRLPSTTTSSSVLRSGVDHVIFNGLEASRLAAPDDVRRAEDPSGVADRGHDLPGLVHLADQFQDPLILTETVRSPAAGNDDRVELGRAHLAERLVRHHGIAFLAGVRGARFRAHGYGPGAIFAKTQQRVPDFELLIQVRHQHRDFLPLKFHV